MYQLDDNVHITSFDDDPPMECLGTIGEQHWRLRWWWNTWVFEIAHQPCDFVHDGAAWKRLSSYPAHRPPAEKLVEAVKEVVLECCELYREQVVS